MPKRIFFPAIVILLVSALTWPQRSAAQANAPVASDAPVAAEASEETVTMFPHSQTARWWVSGQSNTIFQAHPEFHAAYSGRNSFGPDYAKATSRILTLYTGLRLNHSTEVLVDIEDAAGQGMGNSVGLAGYTNLDVVRIPGEGSPLSTAPYLSRVIGHEVIALSHKTVEGDRGWMSTFAKLPERRLEFRFGKMSTADFFDANGVGSDSHLQFENWTVDNNGAYDYAADTRGYTYGFEAEYQSVAWAFRFGEMLMPKVANGIDLDWDLRRARAENYELELRPVLLPQHKSVVRLLAYENHANMGDYREAVARYKAGLDPRPIIQNTERQGTVKYGFGFNAEQELPKQLRAFARLGWNEGQHESFCYTEVDSTMEAGADLGGGNWRRKLDKVGLAVVTNGISADHQHYLQDGGLGFLLGDGNLRYGRENIIESYYTMHVWRGIFVSVDVQRIWNPGYNRDRGPVIVPGLRLHVDL
jgi:hypothetical protein